MSQEVPEKAGRAPRGVVQDRVGRAAVVAHAGAEERLLVEDALEVVLLPEHVGEELEDAETKPASDVQANGPGVHGLGLARLPSPPQ